MTKRKTHEDFVKELHNLNPYIEVIDKYVTTHTKIMVKCLKCGKQWEARPALLTRKNKPVGCPHCNQIHSISHEDFVEKVSCLYPDLEILSQYISGDQDVTCRCKINDTVWKVKGRYLWHGNSSVKCPGCPLAYCNDKNTKKRRNLSTSFNEQYLYHALAQILGYNQVLNRDRKYIGMELDIIIPKYKLAIEIGSWYWHENKIDVDIQKEEACRQQGIHLLTYYEQYPHVHTPEGLRNVQCFQYSLHSEQNHRTLRMITEHVLELIGTGHSVISWNDFELFISRYYLNMMENRFSDFLQQHQNIQALSNYQGEEQSITICCQDCKHTWETTPRKLVSSKYQCPKCAKKKAAQVNSERRNQKALLSFKQWIEKHQPTLSFEDNEFVNNATALKLSCNVCNMEWIEKPIVTKHNKGCPFCSQRVKPVHCIETDEYFISISEAQRKYHASTIQKCCENSNSTSGGFHWEYVLLDELKQHFPEPATCHKKR